MNTATYTDELHEAVTETVGFMHGTWRPLDELESASSDYSGWSDYEDLRHKAMNAGNIAGPLLRHDVPIPVRHGIAPDMRVITQLANEVLDKLGHAFPDQPDAHFLEFYTLVLNFTLKAERNV